MSHRVFLYGTMGDAGLRRIVTGAEPPAAPATLSGYRVGAVMGESFPAMVADADAEAEGLVVELAPMAAQRLDFYEACFGYAPRRVEVGGAAAVTYLPVHPPHLDGAWDFAEWQGRWGAIAREASREVMEYHGHRPAAWVGDRFAQILGRADAAVRAAADGPPQQLRRGFGRADVEVLRHRRPYSEFFSLVEQDLRFRRFDGSWSDTVTRTVLVSGDAVTVLPYDPVRDEVLLVEQFRYGPFVRGDDAPWALEPVAGRVDPGETPEQTARRETHEEAALALDRLELVGRYYASTGALSEYVISYVGLCDLSEAGGDIQGAVDEHEDILTHCVSFDRLMALVASGEAEDAPLLLTAWWLAANRDRLRRG